MQGSTATCADFSCGGTLHPGVWRCGMGAPDIVAGTALAPDAAHLIMAHSHKTAEPAREYSVDKPKVCVLLFIGACASVCTNAFGVAVRPVPAAGTEYPGYGMSGAECPERNVRSGMTGAECQERNVRGSIRGYGHEKYVFCF